MHQSHPSGDQAHKGGFIQHGIARDQLLVEPREGVVEDRGAVEERGSGDGHGGTKRFHATVSFVAIRG